MFLSAQRSIFVDKKVNTVWGNNIKMHATYVCHVACNRQQQLWYVATEPNLVNENHAYAALDPQCTLKYAESREQRAERTTQQNDCKSNWQI